LEEVINQLMFEFVPMKIFSKETRENKRERENIEFLLNVTINM
jgi:hypothetical protein